MRDLRGKTVLITGGGSGIGRLLCVQFAKEGARVVTVDLRQNLLDETTSVVEKETGQRIATFICDLGNRAMIYDVAAQIKSQIGKVDVLVNNAGIVQGKSFLELTDEQIQKTMDVNVMAHMWLAKAFLPDMIRTNVGHIVTIASAAGLVGVNGLADYCASKFAAFGFDESIRLELKAQNITGVHTTCVCPYYINTGMFEGVKPMFLMPILEPNYVVAQIMRAVKGNRATCWLPLLTWIGPLLRSLLPVWLFDLVGKWLGMTRAMSHFKGRGADWANASLPAAPLIEEKKSQ